MLRLVSFLDVVIELKEDQKSGVRSLQSNRTPVNRLADQFAQKVGRNSEHRLHMLYLLLNNP